MSRESVLPTALIRDLQISIRDSFSLPLPLSPSDSPPPPPLPSIQEAVAALDPALDASARCGRCSGGYLGGGVARLCVYCGEGYKGGATAPPEISFVGTIAYKLLLESLGLDGSEAVNLDPDSAEPNKERDSSKAGMTLSDLLDLKLAFSPIKADVTDIESRTKGEPDPTTYDLNLSGIDLDAVFKESKKVTPRIKDTKHTPIQVSSENRTTVTSSFAKWEPDFDSQPVNPSMPVQISVPASENLSQTNQKKEISEIETQADEEFDEWQDFAGSRAIQNLSDMVERVESPTESREPVKPGGDILFDSKDVATSRLDQSRLSDLEGFTSTSQEENLPIEDSESLNVEEKDMFDDWQAFTRSGGDENGAEVKPEFGLPEQVHVKKLEPLSHEDDLFDDWKNFAGPGVAQSGLSVQEEITAFASGDLLTINMEKEPAHTEMSHGDVNESFDEWDDFAGSGLGQGSSLDLGEKSKTIFWDPLNTKNLEEPSNMEVLNADPGDSLDNWKHFTESGVAHVKYLVAEEKTQPRSQDRLAVDEVEPSDRGETLHVKFDDFFDDWKDSSSVLARLPENGGRAEPISDEPKPVSTTEQPSAIGRINVEDDDSFDDWKDSSSVLARLPDDGGRAEPISDELKPVSTTEQTSAIGTINAEDDDSFDDWKDFTSSSAVESGLTDAGENQLPTVGNSSEIFSGWPIGGTESKKASASIDLWSDGVNGVTSSASNNNGNTNLSDGLLDFMLPSQVNGTISNQGAQIDNDAEGSSDNWLDFATVTGPTKSRSENLDFEKKDPDGLFDDWQAFTGSTQSVKPKSNLTEKSSKVGEQKQEDLSEDWLDFTSFSEIKGNPELKTGNNGVSDGWSNFTDMIDVKGPKSKSLSHDWQEIASTGQVSAPVAYHAQDIDFGDFLQSSSSAVPADHVNFDSSNGLHPDPLSFLSMPGNNIFNPNPNSNVNSKNENASDIQKFLSQMNDLSFMLKDELSIPDKLHSK